MYFLTIAENNLLISSPSSSLVICSNALGFESVVGEIFGVLGVVELQEGEYLVVVKEIIRITQEVCLIKKVEFIFLNSQRTFNKNSKAIKLLKGIIEEFMYFSYSRDLTKKMLNTSQENLKFFWNYKMFMKSCQKFSTGIQEFCLTIIQGFYQAHRVLVRGKILELEIISRRDTGRVGPRYAIIKRY
jgi:hypothetical protein